MIYTCLLNSSPTQNSQCKNLIYQPNLGKGLGYIFAVDPDDFYQVIAPHESFPLHIVILSYPPRVEINKLLA